MNICYLNGRILDGNIICIKKKKEQSYFQNAPEMASCEE